MTNPNTWTSNAMQVGVASADPDVADENLEYLKYELDNLNLTQGVEFVKNLIGNQDTDTDHDINFARVNTNYNAEVLVRDASYNVRAVTYAGEMTKQIDATWAAGDDAGGLDDNDTLASGQVLYGFMLVKSSDDSIDYGFTDDITGASLLTDAAVVAAGFDEISVAPIHYLPPLDGSSNIVDHTTVEIEGGGIKVLRAFVLDWAFTTTYPTAYTDVTLSVPPLTEALIYGIITSATMYVKPKISNGTDIMLANVVSGGGTAYGHLSIPTDSSRKIQVKASDTGSVYMKIFSNGYIAKRRS